jgi:hypothetical protein
MFWFERDGFQNQKVKSSLYEIAWFSHTMIIYTTIVDSQGVCRNARTAMFVPQMDEQLPTDAVLSPLDKWSHAHRCNGRHATTLCLSPSTSTSTLLRLGGSNRAGCSPGPLTELGAFLSLPPFLWAHRSGNSSPLRPTRLLLCWFRPKQRWVPSNNADASLRLDAPSLSVVPQRKRGRKKGKRKCPISIR